MEGSGLIGVVFERDENSNEEVISMLTELYVATIIYLGASTTEIVADILDALSKLFGSN